MKSNYGSIKPLTPSREDRRLLAVNPPRNITVDTSQLKRDGYRPLTRSGPTRLKKGMGPKSPARPAPPSGSYDPGTKRTEVQSQSYPIATHAGKNRVKQEYAGDREAMRATSQRQAATQAPTTKRPVGGERARQRSHDIAAIGRGSGSYDPTGAQKPGTNKAYSNPIKPFVSKGFQEALQLLKAFGGIREVNPEEAKKNPEALPARMGPRKRAQGGVQEVKQGDVSEVRGGELSEVAKQAAKEESGEREEIEKVSGKDKKERKDIGRKQGNFGKWFQIGQTVMSDDPASVLVGVGQAGGSALLAAKKIHQKRRAKAEEAEKRRVEARQSGAQRKGFGAARSLLKAIRSLEKVPIARSETGGMPHHQMRSLSNWKARGPYASGGRVFNAPHGDYHISPSAEGGHRLSLPGGDEKFFSSAKKATAAAANHAYKQLPRQLPATRKERGGPSGAYEGLSTMSQEGARRAMAGQDRWGRTLPKPTAKSVE